MRSAASTMSWPSTFHEVDLIVPAAGPDTIGVDVLVNTYPGEVAIVHDRPYGAAIKLGLTRTDSDIVATMDADGQHSWRELLYLYREMQVHNADMVIGQGEKSGLRGVYSSLLNCAASILAGKHVPDFGSGLRVFKRASLPPIEKLPDGFDFNAVVTLAMMLSKRKVLWVPADVRPRRHGKSHVTWHDGVVTVRSLCRARWAHGR